MHRYSHEIVVIIFTCLLLANLTAASTVEMGIWQFDSNLSEERAIEYLADISFRPAPDISKDSWNLTSGTLQFSNFAGDISSEVILTYSCLNLQNCTRTSNIYFQGEGKLIKAGKLSFKQNNIFEMDYPENEEPNSSEYLGEEFASAGGESGSVNLVDMIMGFLEQWYIQIAVIVVVALTLIYMNRAKY